MKRVVCYSGGHSSALVAVEVVRRFGRENVVLLNHDMHFMVEHASIKLFRAEVAARLGLPTTQANYMDAQLDQFDVCVDKAAFKVKNGQEFCTYVLKTLPFMQWLEANCPDRNATIYYGFDDIAMRAPFEQADMTQEDIEEFGSIEAASDACFKSMAFEITSRIRSGYAHARAITATEKEQG